MSPRFVCTAMLGLVLAGASNAAAGPRDVWLLPARVQAREAPEPSPTPAPERSPTPAPEPAPGVAPVQAPPAEPGPRAASEPVLSLVQAEALARRLDEVLSEAVLDFGLRRLQTPPRAGEWDEAALVELGREGWVVAPEIDLRGEALRLRLTVVPHASQTLLVRSQRVAAQELSVRSLRLLRELLESPLAADGGSDALSEAPPAPSAPAPVRSEGRAVLALHTAALGGYIGFSLQRASGSDDARLTYPLIALGAGIGLGSAVIVTEEWDIDLPRAWFLGASMFWPTLGISLLTRRDQEDSERYLLGVAGALGGLTLATAGLALGDVDGGGAAITHSGAVLGLVLGGLAEMAVEGDPEQTPVRGMGWGALTGVALAGTLATQFPMPSATDALSIDLGALLGGLGGAALGTPLLVSQERSPQRDRLWLSGVMAGTVAGAIVAYGVTQSSEPLLPSASDASQDGARVRVELGWQGMPLGLGVAGEW